MKITVNRLSSDAVKVRKVAGDHIVIRKDQVDAGFIDEQLRLIFDMSRIIDYADAIYAEIRKAESRSGMLEDSSYTLRYSISSYLDDIENMLSRFQKKVRDESIRDDAEYIRDGIENIRKIISDPAFDRSWRSCGTMIKIFEELLGIEWRSGIIIDALSYDTHEYIRSHQSI